MILFSIFLKSSATNGLITIALLILHSGSNVTIISFKLFVLVKKLLLVIFILRLGYYDLILDANNCAIAKL